MDLNLINYEICFIIIWSFVQPIILFLDDLPPNVVNFTDRTCEQAFLQILNIALFCHSTHFYLGLK